MQSLVKRIIKQRRLLDAIQDHQSKGTSVEREESDLSRWPSQASSSDAITPKDGPAAVEVKTREEIKKFKLIIGWRDNPKGPKKILVIGVSGQTRPSMEPNEPASSHVIVRFAWTSSSRVLTRRLL